MKSGIISGLVLAAVSISVAAAPGGNKPPRGPTVSGVEVFSHGNPIGVLLSEVDQMVFVLSSTGYVFYLDMYDGRIWSGLSGYRIFFAGPGCTNQAYLQSSGYLDNQGFVFKASAIAPATAYYLPKGSTAATYTFVSQLTGNVCEEREPFEFLGVIALPNDPSVTGVEEIYPLPLALGIP